MTFEARAAVVTLRGTEVVRGVTLALHPGEVVGVLGPSGAGKTTLFRAMVGELELTSGRILLDGNDVSRERLWQRVRRGVGYVPQTPSVLWDLTVQQNLATFERLTRTGEPRSLREWARRVELEDRMEVRAGELSGGERRRLELARALLGRPNVLVCDEPFAGIDPAGAERMGDLLREVAANGAAVVLADHHVAEALRVCDRAVLLVDGRIEASGPPAQFREHPLVQQRYLGSVGAGISWRPDSRDVTAKAPEPEPARKSYPTPGGQTPDNGAAGAQDGSTRRPRH
jgi:lipopolysaccharide export system ATP-binding protein